MKIKKEIYLSLKDYAFCGAASHTAACLDDWLHDGQWIALEFYIEDCYPDGITEDELNDLFAFDQNLIADFFGFDDWAAMYDFYEGD